MCAGTEGAAVEIMRAYGEEFRKNSPTHKLSTLQDLDAHRPLELEETMGFAVRKAAELELKLPLLDAFYRIASASAAY
jgi:ketopantoate reductase